MSIAQRQFIRFSLEVPGRLFGPAGDQREVETQQISVGGCLVDRGDGFYPGDEFRLELELPNGNRVPLTCRVVYCFENSCVGGKFVDISKFEQDLVAKTIAYRLELDGLPLPIDAFEQPPTFADEEVTLKVSTDRDRYEEKLEEVMTLDIEA